MNKYFCTRCQLTLFKLSGDGNCPSCNEINKGSVVDISEPEISDYLIVDGSGSDAVMNKVNSRLSEGWKLKGELISAAAPNGFSVFQVMVKYK